MRMRDARNVSDGAEAGDDCVVAVVSGQVGRRAFCRVAEDGMKRAVEGCRCGWRACRACTLQVQKCASVAFDRLMCAKV